jgi:rhomboid protease GluP
MRSEYSDTYTYTFQLNDIRRGTFYVWAEEAIEQIGWEIISQDENYIEAAWPKGTDGIQNTLLIILREDSAVIQSYCSEEGPAGVQKQHENALLLYNALSEVSVGKIGISDPAAELKSEITEEEIINKPADKQKIRDMLQLLIPRGDFIITPVIILVCMFIYLMMGIAQVDLMQPSPEALIHWGASIKYITLDGQWWRVFTCLFVNPGMMRMLFNLYALLFIGLLLEPVLGAGKFALAFIITGVASSFASLYWHNHVIVAGLSGAIFGLYGLFLSLVVLKVAYPVHLRNGLLLSAILYIGYNLAFSGHYGVDPAGYIGGLATGILLGCCFYPLFVPVLARTIHRLYVPALSVALIAGFTIFYLGMPRGIVRYQKVMTKFAMNEEIALNAMSELEFYDHDLQVKMLQDQGISLWNKNINMLQGLNNMPPELDKRVHLLINYCRLRKEMYSIMLRAVNGEDMSLYQPEILKKGHQISEIVDELQNQDI